MKRYRRLATGAIAALSTLGLISGIVQAQTPANARIARGAVIAAQGTVAGAPPCAQCHAFNGVSDASGAFPRLAGQSAYYLAEQLRDFASGMRSNAFMTPIAKALTADDIADVAAYYSPSTLHSCHFGSQTRRSSRLASSSQKRGVRAGGFRPATIAMAPAAPANRRRSPISQDNTHPTSRLNCGCGSAATERTAPMGWLSWPGRWTTGRLRLSLPTTSRSARQAHSQHRNRRLDVDRFQSAACVGGRERDT